MTACACLTVVYDPEVIGEPAAGTSRARWRCAACGEVFVRQGLRACTEEIARLERQIIFQRENFVTMFDCFRMYGERIDVEKNGWREADARLAAMQEDRDILAERLGRERCLLSWYAITRFPCLHGHTWACPEGRAQADETTRQRVETQAAEVARWKETADSAVRTSMKSHRRTEAMQVERDRAQEYADLRDIGHEELVRANCALLADRARWQRVVRELHTKQPGEWSDETAAGLRELGF